MAGDDRWYTCAHCKGRFYSGWSEVEALAEYAERFPGEPPDEKAELCEDCWQEFLAMLAKGKT